MEQPGLELSMPSFFLRTIISDAQADVFFHPQTPRGAILCFLLFQASIACPDLPERLGVHGPFSEYAILSHHI